MGELLTIVIIKLITSFYSMNDMVWQHSDPRHPLRPVMDNIDVEPGQHYFVECGTRAFGPKFVIREVVCAGAQDMGQRTKPLEPVHMRPDGRPILVTETFFPQCQ